MKKLIFQSVRFSTPFTFWQLFITHRTVDSYSDEVLLKLSRPQLHNLPICFDVSLLVSRIWTRTSTFSKWFSVCHISSVTNSDLILHPSWKPERPGKQTMIFPSTFEKAFYHSSSSFIQRTQSVSFSHVKGQRIGRLKHDHSHSHNRLLGFLASQIIPNKTSYLQSETAQFLVQV